MLDNALLIAILLAIVGQSTVLWKQLGTVQNGLKNVCREQEKVAIALEETKTKSCPFPSCPVFKRAIEEAAPARTIDSPMESRDG